MLLEPHTRIDNLSLSSGRFRSAWKNAIISPLLKKPSFDPKLLLNYRPIAFLPFSGKLIERSVAIQPNDPLAANSVLSDYESANRICHSTETLLISLLNDLLLAADEGDGTTLLFLDLSAAFDTVDHLADIALLFGIGIHQFSDDTQLRIRFRLIEQLLATNTINLRLSAPELVL